jgi:hypothetical protein
MGIYLSSDAVHMSADKAFSESMLTFTCEREIRLVPAKHQDWCAIFINPGIICHNPEGMNVG